MHGRGIEGKLKDLRVLPKKTDQELRPEDGKRRAVLMRSGTAGAETFWR